MSLIVAFVVFVLEVAVIFTLVLLSKDERRTRNALSLITLTVTAVSAIIAFGLAGTSELLNVAPSTHAWNAVGLAVANALLFVSTRDALEHKYGSTPTSTMR